MSDGLELKPGLRWVLYGPSGSGKTWTAIQILSLHKRLQNPPVIILISPNASNDETWKRANAEWDGGDLIDEHYTELSEDVKSLLTSIIDRRLGGEGDPKPIFLMIDDLGEEHSINRTYINNPIRKIVVSARHLQTSLMMLYQGVNQTLGVLAKNADIVVAKKILNIDDRKKFHKLYLGEYSTEEFDKITRKCWQDPYDSMVLDKTTPGLTRVFRNFSEEVKVREEVNFGVFD